MHLRQISSSATPIGSVKLRQGHKAQRVQVSLRREPIEGLGHEVSVLLASGALGQRSQR